MTMKLFMLINIFLICINYCFCWGPFPSCGEIQNVPENLDDCDNYSLDTGVGCCLATLQNESKNKECILIGGRAQGWFNNQTEPVSLSNLDFPQDVANRTDAAAQEYMSSINKTYWGQPSAVVKCVDNKIIALEIASFLILALIILIV
mmetsp:Transcript_1768/g.1781  ORF Transcript_1768/g.1781 Transcript_1768/m.1781 type:complete len:148 (-) Transcript_1768:1401-1844(-)